MDSNIKDSTNNNIGLTTFPFDPNEAPFRRGKLKEHLEFRKNEIQASEFVLDIIKHGHKPTLRSTPEPYFIPNRSSALKHKQFVNDSLKEVLSLGCINEVKQIPKFINPLHVAVQSSGKLRLILDLSHFNSFLLKKSCKYEDLKVALQFFEKGNFVFAFDLKSAYHNIELQEDFRQYYSFKWELDGVIKYFQFNVLVFGDAEAPYVCSKVLRQPVKYWRKQGIRIVLYLDDGIGGSCSFSEALSISIKIYRDLLACGLTPNHNKCTWIPVQILKWLGFILDLKEGFLKVPESKIDELCRVIAQAVNASVVHVKLLASIAGHLISMSMAIGEITRLMTRHLYALINSRFSWSSQVEINDEVREELQFWYSH